MSAGARLEADEDAEADQRLDERQHGRERNEERRRHHRHVLELRQHVGLERGQPHRNADDAAQHDVQPESEAEQAVGDRIRLNASRTSACRSGLPSSLLVAADPASARD
jgi:hypothetical protein